MTNEERLKAAGFRPTGGKRTVTEAFAWTRDGDVWFTEDEALVVVLTAERDAAIARAERAEATSAEARASAMYIVENRAVRRGARDVVQIDAVSGGFVHVGLLVDDDWIDAEIEKATAAIARAEAAEAMAASIAQLVGEVESEDIDVFEFFDAVEKAVDPLRAHAAKVSR